MEQIPTDCIQLLRCHDSDVNSCDFGPKDKLATASSDHSIRLWHWDFKSREFREDVKSPLKHHAYAVNEVRFSPQGTMLATGSTDGSTAIWDLATCTVMCTFVQPSRLGVRCCRFSPDSTMLVTSGDDDSACIWNIGSRSLMKKLGQAAEHTVFCCEFTPNGEHLVSCDANGDIRLWSVQDNHHKAVAMVEEAHDLGVLCCEFAPWTQHEPGLDCQFVLATGGNDDCVRLWTVVTGLHVQITSKKRLSKDHRGTVMCVRFSKDGLFVASTGGDKLVCIYHVDKGTIFKKLHPHDRYVGSCAFSWSGAFFVTGSNDKCVAVFEWLNPANAVMTGCQDLAEEDQRMSVLSKKEDAQLMAKVKAHEGDINDMAFISDTQLITCSSDKCVKLWSVSPQGEIVMDKLVDQRQYAIYACDFAQDVLVIGSMEGQAMIWHTKTWKLLGVLIPPGQAVIRCCKLSQDGKYVIIAGDDDMAHIFDLQSFDYVKEFKGPEATIFFATLTHDSSLVFCGDNDGVIWGWKAWSQDKKPCFLVDGGHDLGVSCGDILPMTSTCRYSTITTGGNDSLLKVWRVYTQGGKSGSIKLVLTLNGHGGSVMSVKYAKNGLIMASTSLDKTLRLWDANSYAYLRVIEGHERYVKCCAFNPKCDLIASGSNDKCVNVWKLSCNLTMEDGAYGVQDPYFVEGSEGVLAKIPYDRLVKSLGLTKSQAQQLLSKSSRVIKDDKEIPEEFICPITQDVMINPVLCCDGFVYEKAAIEEWLVSRKKTSPMTNLPMENTQLVPQAEMQERIKDFLIK